MPQTDTSAPVIKDQSDFYWESLSGGRLVFQYCLSCGEKRFPFRMSCSRCGSFEHAIEQSAGAGVVVSHTRVEKPLIGTFTKPYHVVLVELDEGVRMLGVLKGTVSAPLIGRRVVASFSSESPSLLCFIPDGQSDAS